MRIVIPAMRVAVAAVVVWATIRLINWRKRPGPKFCFAAACVMAFGYPLSFGPACWLCNVKVFPLAPVGYFYWPLVNSASESGFGSDLLDAYANFWTPRADIAGDLMRAVAESM